MSQSTFEESIDKKSIYEKIPLLNPYKVKLKKYLDISDHSINEG